MTTAVFADNFAARSIALRVTDTHGETSIATTTLEVRNVDPIVSDATFTIVENTPNGTSVGSISATDQGSDTLVYRILGGTGAFAIDSATGEITVADSSQLDYETTKFFTLQIEVEDDDGGFGTATVTINLLNQASITGVVYVDANGNGQYDADEMGIDGVTIRLLDSAGNSVRDANNQAIVAITRDGGYYLFEDLAPGTYQLDELQPTGVSDGAESLGSLGGTVVANDRMQLVLERTDAADYAFAELGQQVGTGDAATIGFWQNKNGQALIAQGGADLAEWLTANFRNGFGNSLVGASGQQVGEFFRDQLFRQLSQKSSGPAKVDAQFMAVAFATYFTSRTLAGEVAAAYGFHVTDTGIGTKLVNVRTSGTAFDTANWTDRTILQLLKATSSLTDLPDQQAGFAFIYDRDGNGLIDAQEAQLRVMANEIFTSINEAGRA